MNNLLNYNAKSQQLSLFTDNDLDKCLYPIKQSASLMSSPEHKAHFHARFHMFHINYRQP